MELVPAAVKNLLLEEAAEVQRRMDALPYWQEVLAGTERWPIDLQHTQVTSSRTWANQSHPLFNV